MRNFYGRLLTRAFKLVTRLQYPDPVDRAVALGAECAELLNVFQFSKGDPLEAVLIEPHPKEGYLVGWRNVSDREPT